MVAASPEAVGLGPLVVLNDEIHAARFVAKGHSTRASTFVSGGTGPIGETVESRVHLWFTPRWEDHLGLPASLEGIDVELVKMVTGMPEAPVRAAIERRPSAIVIDGFGGGHVPPPLVPLLAEGIRAGVPIVIATRALAGRTLEETYGMPGGEIDLGRNGVIAAGHLSGQKARLRLMVGLALGREPASLFPVS
jgi:L-asparaginase